MTSALESDEAFARRLQAQEMGIRPPDSQTPLMHDGQQTRPENPTVLNSRLNELASARMSVYFITVVNVPQVIFDNVISSFYFSNCCFLMSLFLGWLLLFIKGPGSNHYSVNVLGL